MGINNLKDLLATQVNQEIEFYSYIAEKGIDALEEAKQELEKKQPSQGISDEAISFMIKLMVITVYSLNMVLEGSEINRNTLLGLVKEQINSVIELYSCTAKDGIKALLQEKEKLESNIDNEISPIVSIIKGMVIVLFVLKLNLSQQNIQ